MDENGIYFIDTKPALKFEFGHLWGTQPTHLSSSLSHRGGWVGVFFRRESFSDIFKTGS